MKGNPLAVHDMESTPPAVLFDDSDSIIMTGKTEKKKKEREMKMKIMEY